MHLELVDQFRALGYTSYRLVPALDLLVPFDAGDTPDGFLLNLFACKTDCAERLAARGHLLIASAPPGHNALQSIPRRYEWRQALSRLPYADALKSFWDETLASGQSEDVVRALALYALSADPSQPAVARFSALQESLGLLEAASRRKPSYLRLASLARVAQAFGSRGAAVASLQRLCSDIVNGKQLDPREPFLAPAQRFDALPCGANVGNWVLAATLEEWERLGSFSSYYSGEASRQRLEIIAALGFASAEMSRRLQLVEARFPSTASQPA